LLTNCNTSTKPTGTQKYGRGTSLFNLRTLLSTTRNTTNTAHLCCFLISVSVLTQPAEYQKGHPDHKSTPNTSMSNRLTEVNLENLLGVCVCVSVCVARHCRPHKQRQMHAYHSGPEPLYSSEQTRNWTTECCMQLKMALPVSTDNVKTGVDLLPLGDFSLQCNVS